MAQLHSRDLDAATDLCRKASEWIDRHGTFRMRVLMQMLLIELEKDRVRSAADKGRRPDESQTEYASPAG